MEYNDLPEHIRHFLSKSVYNKASTDIRQSLIKYAEEAWEETMIKLMGDDAKDTDMFDFNEDGLPEKHSLLKGKAIEYEQIKKDVEEFKNIAKSVGLLNYCAIGSSLLQCCLIDKSIKAKLVKGYLIIDDIYWVLHVWIMININDDVRQIDITHNPLKEIGRNMQYSRSLNDKWKSLIDIDKEQDDYDNIIEFYSLYETKGVENALAYIANKMEHKHQWKVIINHLSTLPTFTTIKNHTKIFCL